MRTTEKMPKLSGRKRVFFIVAVVTPVALALVAIYIDATTFSLEVKVSPKNGGTVRPDKTVRCRGVTPVTLEAEAADGYVFTGWSGASDLAVTPLTINLDGDKVLTANFERFEPRTVQIGNRMWMAENLNIIPSKPWCYYYDEYHNDCIFGKSWCYDNDESNCLKYGRLYDYHAAMAVCPAPWRLPTKDDWNSLIRVGGYKTGKKLKSKTGWDDRECREYKHGYSREIDCPDSVRSGNGTDEFGFSALPGGEGEENHYHYVGKMGQWWTNVFGEWYQLDNRDELENNRCIGCRGSEGASVRCVQDIPGVPEKVVGSDDPTSPIVKSWKSGALTVTFYANGLLRVSGNGKMEDCYPPWREYQRVASLYDCNSPWRDYPVAGLIIEDGVTHIGSHAFDGCRAMSSVTIPSSVASIGGEAFGYCTSLRSIIIRNPNPLKIVTMRGRASDVFENYYEKIMEKACLYVPANSIDAYRAADGWKDFSCIKELESAPGGK
jgi:uncharacterized protein (TIGR02145 family)/uncharacterized repeat protein (TIGR02543 family)